MTPLETAAIALALIINPSAPKKEDARVIAQSAAWAVELDPKPPLTGTKVGDVALMLETAMGESTMTLTKNGECVRGDGGKALGPLQLQHVPAVIACSAFPAAQQWLVMAHASVSRCSALPVDAQLAGLFSGNCGHGLAMSRLRLAHARAAERALVGR